MTKPNRTSWTRRILAASAASVLLQASAPAALYISPGSFTDNGAGSGVIPDNSPIGLSDACTLSGLGPSILDAVLTVHLSGSFIDDLRGYVRLGNSDTSASISLDPYFAPGNRDISVDLEGFQGLDPNNAWRLFFADSSAGGQNRLVGWSLEVTAVPEPMNVALAVFGLVLGGAGAGSWALKWRRRAQVQVPPRRGRFRRWSGGGQGRGRAAEPRAWPADDRQKCCSRPA